MNNPITLTISDLKSAIQIIAYNQKNELPISETIGDPTYPLHPFEQIIRSDWFYHGGSGNPPKLVVSERFFTDLMKLGCPKHLLHIAKKL